MTDPDRFARLVAMACHDIRTPLATVFGFTRMLKQKELDERAQRYVDLMETACGQLTELLDELGVVARIEEGRYDPELTEVDSLELARSAAARDEGGVAVSGHGAPVRAEPDAMRRALAQLARAARRHGAVASVEIAVEGAVVEIRPIAPRARAIVLGEEVQELPAAAAVAVLRALGASLECPGETLVVRLPAA